METLRGRREQRYRTGLMDRRWPTLPRGVRRLFRLPPTRERLVRDANDEVRLHIDLRVEELRALGLSEAEARAEALRRFGDPAEFRDYADRRATKNARRAGFRASLNAWWQDVRFADRQFRRAPAFTALAVLTLALGIGANAAIFSVVHHVLLAPLPYPDGNRIVMLLTEGEGEAEGFPSVAALRAIRARSHSVQTVAAVSVIADAVQEDDGQDTVYAVITPNYLNMLGVAPALGRSFTPAEERGEGAPVAMISYARWQREFGGRADAVDSTVDINYYDGGDSPERRRYTIVGVTPPSMALPMSPAAFNQNLHDAQPGVWLPSDLPRWTGEAHPHSYARLRGGVSVEQATRELQRIVDSSPEAGERRSIIKLMRAQDMLDPTQAHMIEVLFAAVGVLLLISCANVANLLMARAWVRRREFAVRTALGAGRARLARQVLTESTLMALAGGLLGVAIAWLTLRAVIALRPPTLANLDHVHIESTVLLWSAAISVLTGLLFGTLPALFAARGSVADVLHSETRRGSGSIATRRVRSALIVFEIALSLMLLVGAGLLVRSFAAMQRVPLGFDPRGMVSFDVLFNPRTSRARSARAALRNEIVERLRAVPGVTDAAIGTNPAAGFGGLETLSTDPDPTGDVRSVPEYSTIFVGPNYFRVARIRLSEGRVPDSLSVSTGPNAAPTEVVVNRGLAARLWPNGSALGARLHTGDSPSSREDFIVVGVAEDVRVPGAHRLARSAVLYLPPLLASFIVRTATPDTPLVPALRKAISSVEPSPYIQTTTIGETFIRDSLAPTRFAMALFVAFATVALVLATVGLYGVISYGVVQRTREIGVRVALGAEPAAVTRLVVANGLRLAIAGIGLGAVAAIGAGRALSGMLFGVSAADPATLVAITVLVVAIALFASYVPARRALRIDPSEALRAE
ncbi:MAG TPA: ABC transporter permease [Gemmatimonadaceae bacterium]|nr:ABC transporter permease [Gemmatimonadaceae bacterium]